MKPQFTKFTHKTPHLGKKQHQLDPNLDMKQLVHHSTVQYVDRDADGDVDIYDNPKKPVPDENPIKDFGKVSKTLMAKQKGELKHTRRGMAYEGWSEKYKKSIDCDNPKGFSQKAHCQGRKKRVDEDLRKWFGTGSEGGVGGGGWDRYNTKGERIGKCAREPGEGKPKCLSKEKAAKMSKDEIAAAVKRKRKEDPVADRPGKGGKPKMVSNKIQEQMGSVRYCPKCQKNETRSECAYGPRYWDMFSMPPAIMTNQAKYDIAQIHPTNEQKDHEHSMARSELSTVENAVKRLKKKMGKGEGNIEAWVQSKITKAADYLDSAADYLDSGEHDIEEAKGPCWTGYKQVGMKKKGGKEVPNCVPVSESDLTIDPQKHRQAQRAQKIRTLAQKGSTEGERAAAERKTKGPKLFGEDIKLVDKILLQLEAEVINEKNVPTNPTLWSKMKSRAKAKFDVYPSAYANGWAAKEYKKAGGGWKSVSEDVELEEAVRIPAKTGNLMHVMLTWKGKFYSLKIFFPQVSVPSRRDVQDQIEKVYPGARVQSYHVAEYEPGEPFLQTEDWQSVNRKDKTDGLSQKAVDAYRKENPGSKLQTAVTEKKPTGKRAERRKSFCRRMTGMKKRLTSAETARDPDSRINKALRRWNCN